MSLESQDLFDQLKKLGEVLTGVEASFGYGQQMRIDLPESSNIYLPRNIVAEIKEGRVSPNGILAHTYDSYEPYKEARKSAKSALIMEGTARLLELPFQEIVSIYQKQKQIESSLEAKSEKGLMFHERWGKIGEAQLSIKPRPLEIKFFLSLQTKIDYWDYIFYFHLARTKTRRRLGANVREHLDYNRYRSGNAQDFGYNDWLDQQLQLLGGTDPVLAEK